eukprot:CAMPEP_0167767760 /NCGR_PEP_ID=MMETSP0110_2-20121227/16251_1 /TAXON_ID=629695 /ORGANISM="Gymnochlora sp., Strain CCMP2014" /LENGTH=159 /DNA_ID=CAMNT_0007656279 /DNA_START=194 /DNA_END=670 /DNA_ORIENTATION=+
MNIKILFVDNIYFTEDGDYHDSNLKLHKVRKISADGIVSTVAGSEEPNCIDGTGSVSRFYLPSDVEAVEERVFVSDQRNNVLRVLDFSEHFCPNVTTLAGKGVGYYYVEGELEWLEGLGEGHQDGPGPLALFHGNSGVAFSRQDRCFYVADMHNSVIRK